MLYTSPWSRFELTTSVVIGTDCIGSCKVCQWLATGQWFSSGTPGFSTNKTDCHDITEILLKVALITIEQTNKQTWEIWGNPSTGHMRVTLCHEYIMIWYIRLLSFSTNRNAHSIITYMQCSLQDRNYHWGRLVWLSENGKWIKGKRERKRRGRGTMRRRTKANFN